MRKLFYSSKLRATTAKPAKVYKHDEKVVKAFKLP